MTVNTENAEIPRFKHDSHCCLFVGHFDSQWGEFDGYVCPKEGTVIARHSDAGQDYIAMPISLVESSKHKLLKPIADKYAMLIHSGGSAFLNSNRELST